MFRISTLNLFANKAIFIFTKSQMQIMASPRLSSMGDSPYKAAFSPGLNLICVHLIVCYTLILYYRPMPW